MCLIFQIAKKIYFETFYKCSKLTKMHDPLSLNGEGVPIFPGFFPDTNNRFICKMIILHMLLPGPVL
jgi:hypothetical protein